MCEQVIITSIEEKPQMYRKKVCVRVGSNILPD